MSLRRRRQKQPLGGEELLPRRPNTRTASASSVLVLVRQLYWAITGPGGSGGACVRVCVCVGLFSSMWYISGFTANVVVLEVESFEPVILALEVASLSKTKKPKQKPIYITF